MAGSNPGHFCFAIYQRVVPANAETHAAASRLSTVADALCYNRLRWLWVPACAGTTCGEDAPLQPQLLLALAERAQPQRVEFDKTRRVAVIVGDGAFLEGDEILIV